VLLKLAAS